MNRKLNLVTPLEVLEESGILNVKTKSADTYSSQISNMDTGSMRKDDKMMMNHQSSKSYRKNFRKKSAITGAATGSITPIDIRKSSGFNVNTSNIHQAENEIMSKFDNKVFLLGEMDMWQESIASAQASGRLIVTMISAIYQ